MAVVPIMSSVLKWRDTTILLLAVVGNITGQFITSFSKSMEVLYLAYVLWMLWNTITTISRSSLTKFMAPNEVGKAFSVLGILQSVFPFVTKPFFAFLYKSTLDTFPGAFRILSGSLYTLVLALLIYTHVSMKRQEREQLKARDRKVGDEPHVAEEMMRLNEVQ